jgi:hypothetical protein
MTPLIIGPDERRAIFDLRELASANPIDMAVRVPTLRTKAGMRKHMAQMNRQTISLPTGFTLTYSIELNHPDGRTMRHMSMAVKKKGRVPSPTTVWMACEELGFVGVPLANSAVWIEKLDNGGDAINVVQPL